MAIHPVGRHTDALAVPTGYGYPPRKHRRADRLPVSRRLLVWRARSASASGGGRAAHARRTHPARWDAGARRFNRAGIHPLKPFTEIEGRIRIRQIRRWAQRHLSTPRSCCCYYQCRHQVPSSWSITCARFTPHSTQAVLCSAFPQLRWRHRIRLDRCLTSKAN